MSEYPQPPANAPRRYSASQLPPDADPAEKEFIGLLSKALAPSYMLIRRLGAGGMGTVYVARDPVLKRLVAVKVMSPELSRDPDARTRFSREAQAVAALSHPNVVAVYAVGELENGLPYIVMQYVEGRSMAERVHEDGPLDVATAKRVLGEVAQALSATHRKGIIHRDIKPANILWDDESGRALVTDFGIAAVREHPDERGREAVKITQTGMSVGTPAYMSPEQFLAEPVTEKTDIYALGLLGYELLTGDGPYLVKSPAEMMVAHMRDEPRRLSTLRPEVDAELDALMGKCLEKDPTKRPAAQYVADHLSRGVSALLEWPPPGMDTFAPRFSDATRSLVVGGLLIGVPLLGLSTLTLDDPLRRALPSPGALAVLSAAGLLALLAGGAGMLKLLRDGARLVRRGFTWLTVAEAACDARGDTGALIAGAREYAALSPANRGTLRTRRLAAGALNIVGALMPLVGYLFGLMIAVRFGGGPVWLVLSSLWLGVAMLVVARLSVWMEEWRLRSSRKRLSQARAARSQEAEFGGAWTSSLISVSLGQKLGDGMVPGTTRTLYLKYAVALMGIVFIVGASALSFSVAFTGAAFEEMFDNLGGYIAAGTLNRVRRIVRLERLRLPADTSISPIEAGAALRDLKSRREFRRSDAVITDYARNARRLPKATRDSLRDAASDPGLPLFRRFARARTYDFWGATTTQAQLDSMNLFVVPKPKVAVVRSLASANIAAGLLAMADGRTAEAEMRFREVLSAGFLMMFEGGLPIDAIMGSHLVARSRIALAELYAQTGRASEAAFASVASDPQDAAGSERPLRLNQSQARVSALRLLADSGMIRSVRNDVLIFPLSYGPCGDLRQILFGVDYQYTAALATARRQLVRFPSDSVWFDKVTYALERPMLDGFGDVGAVYVVINTVARVVDFLTGSKRMQSCASMLS